MFSAPNERCIAAIQARITNLEAEVASLKKLLQSLTHDSAAPTISFSDIANNYDAAKKEEKKTEEQPSLTAADWRVCRSPVKPPEEIVDSREKHGPVCRS